MITTVGELRRRLAPYDKDTEVCVVGNVHDGKNGFAISDIEVVYCMSNESDVRLALMAFKPVVIDKRG